MRHGVSNVVPLSMISANIRVGLYNHDWSGWRSAAAIADLKVMVAATLGH